MVPAQCEPCTYRVVPTVQGGEVLSAYVSLQFGRVYLAGCSQDLAVLVEDDGAGPFVLQLQFFLEVGAVETAVSHLSGCRE